MKKRVDYRHFLCGGILAGSVALTFTVYFDTLKRLGWAFCNLWQSLKLFWFFFIDEENDIEASVLNMQRFPLEKYLSFDLDELARKLKKRFRVPFSIRIYSLIILKKP